MRMRQIRTTVVLLVLIAGMIFAAFYFEEHPFLENAGRPTPTPEPQPSPTFRAFNPMRTVGIGPTATPAPTAEPTQLPPTPGGRNYADLYGRRGNHPDL